MLDKKLCGLCTTAYLLVIVGALNWGLVGAGMLAGADWNVVHMLLGTWPQVEAVVYVLVGLAALYKLLLFSKCCGKKGGACPKCGNAGCNGACS